MCDLARILLQLVDGPPADDIGLLLPAEPLDLMVSLSWRYLVPLAVVDRFRLGAVNLHRDDVETRAVRVKAALFDAGP